ncbi:hypothetical protein CYMTET_53088 [Cymbomonas tetramitiformis]|uniref:Uncharacterized protein n=1 Tax=Cymbomonas tetramitiformis TaxID=36881 RepID=A0AAE0BHY5_9CHLO|nr:hypothetical protein CYMTET_53088 [Cymbomonas tetramitiformis]
MRASPDNWQQTNAEQLTGGRLAEVQLEERLQAVIEFQAAGGTLWVDRGRPGVTGACRQPGAPWGPEVFHSDRQMALPASERGAPSAYRLHTPKQWEMHDAFTVDRLSPVESSSNRFVERAKEIPLPLVHVSERKKTHVESVERSRTRQHKGRRWTEYLVK